MRSRRLNQIRGARQQGVTSWSAVVGFFLLLALPSLALSRLASLIDWRLVVGGPTAMSLVTYFMYRSDKRSAEAGEWRIPEGTLHMAEFLGGWPGAFLAQRDFRHKISKRSYQVEFWLLVLVHEVVSLDYVFDRKFSKQLLELMGTHMA